MKKGDEGRAEQHSTLWAGKGNDVTMEAMCHMRTGGSDMASSQTARRFLEAFFSSMPATVFFSYVAVAIGCRLHSLHPACSGFVVCSWLLTRESGDCTNTPVSVVCKRDRFTD